MGERKYIATVLVPRERLNMPQPPGPDYEVTCWSQDGRACMEFSTSQSLPGAPAKTAWKMGELWAHEDVFGIVVAIVNDMARHPEDLEAAMRALFAKDGHI